MQMDGKMEIKYSRDHVMTKIESTPMEAAFMFCAIIGRVYSTIKKNDPELAELFRDVCRTGLDKNSPVWRSPERDSVAVFMKMVGQNDA